MHCKCFDLGSMAMTITTLPYLSLHICELTDCWCVVGSNKFNTGNKTAFFMLYIFFSKPVYATNFSCILCRNYLALCSLFLLCFSCFGTFLAICSVWRQIFKRGCVSYENKSMTLFINPFISAYDSTVQDLTAWINQKWPLLGPK